MLCACGQETVKISDSDTPEQLLERAYACAYPEEGNELDIDAALLYFTAAAERGSGEAANWLGEAYRWGEMAEQNDELALQWFERGAELENIYSMNSLADMLENCEGVETDMERASELYIRSAELGCEYAFNDAGRMYAEGIGVEQDGAKAAEWYEKALAADPEDPWSIADYARLYMNGNGVEQDYAKAAEWFEKSLEIEPEDPWTIADYARLYMDGLGVEQDLGKAAEMAERSLDGDNIWASYLVPELSSRGYSFGRETVLKAVECLTEIRDPDCIGWLGDIYFYGNDQEPNAENALAAYEGILFNKDMQADYEYWDNLIRNCRCLYANGADTEENLNGAILCECAAFGVDISSGEVADEDYTAAMSNIAYDYLCAEDGVEQNIEKGLALYERAGSMGHGHAYYNLGNIYNGSDFVSADTEKALDYYEKGAALGDMPSVEAAGAMHIKGEGCEADFGAALKLVADSCGCTEAEACNNIAAWYYDGVNVEQDLTKAFELFSTSADGGCADAMRNLAMLYINGEGTAKDEAKAFEYANKALENGSTDSFVYTTLGNAYYKGLGTETDCLKAAEYYEKGAADDPDYAYFLLGDLYTYGSDDIKDDAKAMESYRLALESLGINRDISNNGYLLCAVGEAYNSVYNSIHDPDKGREFFVRAIDFYLPLAEADDGDAICGLAGAMYLVNKSYTAEQIEWLERGMELGNTDCICYLAGIYIDSNPAKAAELYQTAYDAGSRDPSLMNNLAFVYLYKLHETEKGLALYEEAEDYFSLGGIYEKRGGGVSQDLNKALEYYMKDLDSRDPSFSCRHIGHIYYSMGDYEKAKEYYEKYLFEYNANDGYADEVMPRLSACYGFLGV